jgi:hypothetical protein
MEINLYHEFLHCFVELSFYVLLRTPVEKPVVSTNAPWLPGGIKPNKLIYARGPAQAKFTGEFGNKRLINAQK